MRQIVDMQIVMVEFTNGQPFTATTRHSQGGYSHYDLEWCKRDECLYAHESGSGPKLYLEGGDSDYWLAEGETQPEGNLPLTGSRLAEMPVQWPLNSLLDHEQSMPMIYCSACDDWLPWEDYGDLCDHVHWCEQCSWWTGPGYTDSHCKHATPAARLNQSKEE